MTAAPLRDAVRQARDARDRALEGFARAVLEAHEAGNGYGTIASWLGMPKSTIQGIVRRYRKGNR
jgi:hypothetical protein